MRHYDRIYGDWVLHSMEQLDWRKYPNSVLLQPRGTYLGQTNPAKISSLPPTHVSPANYASLRQRTNTSYERTLEFIPFPFSISSFDFSIRLEIAAAVNVVTEIDGLSGVISRGQIVWVYHIIKLLQVTGNYAHTVPPSPSVKLVTTSHHPVNIFTEIDQFHFSGNFSTIFWQKVTLCKYYKKCEVELSIFTKQIPNFQRFSSKLQTSTMKTTLFSGRNHNSQRLKYPLNWYKP